MIGTLGALGELHSGTCSKGRVTYALRAAFGVCLAFLLTLLGDGGLLGWFAFGAGWRRVQSSRLLFVVIRHVEACLFRA